jgi:hypothetical protein
VVGGRRLSANQRRGFTVEFVAWTQFDAPVFDLDGVPTSTADVHLRAWHQTLSASVVEDVVAPAYTNAGYFTYVDNMLRCDGVRAGADVVVRDLAELMTP